MRKIVGMVVLLLALCLLINAGSQMFTSKDNIQNLTRHIALLAIFAIGEGMVILSGGIDLSVSSIIAFGATLLAFLVVSHGVSPVLAGAVVIAFGVVVGLWHGFLVSRVKLQPFIATLCTFLILRGQARVLVNDQTMGFGNRFMGLQALGAGSVQIIPGHPIPIPVLFLVGVAIVAAFFLHFTIYGRYLYAIGRNPQAAEYSGVKVGRMQTAAYVASGSLAALAGILYAGYSNSVQPAQMGSGYELYAIAGAVLGGCSLRGGEGTVIGVIVGAAVMRVMANGINLLEIPSAWEFAVIGYIILTGVVGDSVYKQLGARLAASQGAMAADAEELARRTLVRRAVCGGAALLLVVSLFLPLLTAGEAAPGVGAGAGISYFGLLSLLRANGSVPLPLYLPLVVIAGLIAAAILSGDRAVKVLVGSGALGAFTIAYFFIGISKGLTYGLEMPGVLAGGFLLYTLACLAALLTGLALLIPGALPRLKLRAKQKRRAKA